MGEEEGGAGRAAGWSPAARRAWPRVGVVWEEKEEGWGVGGKRKEDKLAQSVSTTSLIWQQGRRQQGRERETWHNYCLATILKKVGVPRHYKGVESRYWRMALHVETRGSDLEEKKNRIKGNGNGEAGREGAV